VICDNCKSFSFYEVSFIAVLALPLNKVFKNSSQVNKRAYPPTVIYKPKFLTTFNMTSHPITYHSTFLLLSTAFTSTAPNRANTIRITRPIKAIIKPELWVKETGR
jgi:hypothetical protein